MATSESTFVSDPRENTKWLIAWLHSHIHKVRAALFATLMMTKPTIGLRTFDGGLKNKTTLIQGEMELQVVTGLVLHTHASVK